MITIVDYDCGNLGSIRNMLLRLGHKALITSDPSKIEEAEKIILPGVGSFDYGMSTLRELGLVDLLSRKKDSKTPILGICLGAQLMCLGSEEGKLAGLGWIDASVIRFPARLDDKKFLVPHIGWDIVSPLKPSRLMSELQQDPRFYFVHSYYIKCNVEQDRLISNSYSAPFDSAFERDNILGVQFHPEKSHKFGQQLLKNFVEKY